MGALVSAAQYQYIEALVKRSGEAGKATEAAVLKEGGIQSVWQLSKGGASALIRRLEALVR